MVCVFCGSGVRLGGLLDTASMAVSLVRAQELCRISPPRFLAVCCKRRLNQGSFEFAVFCFFSDLCLVCVVSVF